LKNKDINIGVYGSPPSSVGNGAKIDFADVFKRNEMTIEFNEYLKTKCQKNNIPFKDISKKLMSSNGDTDPKYIMDDIHLSQEAMPSLITEFSDIINK
jgi:lysophospholipase L1-like esterase